MEFVYFLFYLAMWALSVGVMKSWWDFDWGQADTVVGVLFITFFWPVWWIIYLPYKIGEYLVNKL